jgi:hypothetical protein
VEILAFLGLKWLTDGQGVDVSELLKTNFTVKCLVSL